jgi:hypothetical protein
MENPNSQTLATLLRQALLAAIALLMGLLAWSVYQHSTENLAQFDTWKRYEGEIKDSHRGRWAEVEIDKALAESLPALRRPESNESSHGKVNVLLANRRFAWYDHFDRVQLARDPSPPDRLVILDDTAMWLPVAAQTLLLALLAAGAGWLWATPWDRDRTWTGDGWQITDPMGQRAGAGALLAEPIREPKGNQVFAAVLGVALLLPFSLWMLAGLVSYPVEAALQLTVALPLLALALRSVARKHTRRLSFDALGVSDADFFGVRRVPWNAIKDMKLVNLNARSQQLYDQTRLKDREGPRPQDNLGAWDVKGESGVVLFRLYKSMLPPDALRALRGRIGQQLPRAGKGVFSAAAVNPLEQEVDDLIADAQIRREGERLLDPDNAADRRLIEEHEKAMSQFSLDMAGFEKGHKRAERGMQVFMVLVVSGLVLGTASLAWQSMWDEAMLLGGLTLFVGLLAGAVWWGTMRTPRR